METLSIIIPSVNDPRLQDTVDDLRTNAGGKIEIIVMMDDKREGLRAMVNRGVAKSTGKYLMKVDDHCRFDKYYDTKLLADIEDSWIVVPRRYELDTDKWEVMDDIPIDCERLVINNPDKIGGVKWRTRARQRRDVLIDETMVFQGSCWVMSRKHWDWLGGLQEEGYGTFAQEPVELALKTWLGGGKVVVNKKTWYAHKHRKFGRIYAPPGIREGNKYSRDFWLNDRWENRIHNLDWLMKRFGL